MNSLMTSSPIATAYFLCVAAILGLVMGSFINCWAWRYMNGESILSGRSHCTSCGHALGLLDLIPVFSWLASRGKCRYCGAHVSVRYLVTELVCAATFVGIVAVYGLSLETLELLIFACVLLFLSLTDIDDYLIPNGCIIVAIVVRVVYLGVTWALGTTTVDQIIYYAASGFGMGVALVIVVLVADHVFGRDSMGGGDLKLYFVAGLYFGWQRCLLLVIISCIIGIIVAFVAAKPGGETQNEPENEREDASEGASEGAGDGVNEGMSEDTREGTSEGEGEDENGGENEDEGEHESSDEPAPSDSDSVLKRTIPFGPSIAAACVIVMLVGQPIIDWYIGFLR